MARGIITYDYSLDRRAYSVVPRRLGIQYFYRLLHSDTTFTQSRSRSQAPRMGTPPHGVRHSNKVTSWGTVADLVKEPRARRPVMNVTRNRRIIFSTDDSFPDDPAQAPANRLKTTFHSQICHLSNVNECDKGSQTCSPSLLSQNKPRRPKRTTSITDDLQLRSIWSLSMVHIKT